MSSAPRAEELADELEMAADAIADFSRAALHSLLRTAAVQLRNREGLTFDEDVDEAVDLLAAGLVLLRHKCLFGMRLLIGAAQHGHRGSSLTSAAISCRRIVAIEFGT